MAKQEIQKRETLAKVVDLVRLRHLSLNTERDYCYQIGLYIEWLGRHGKDLPDSRARIEAYLTAMAHRGCGASTQNQALSHTIP